MPTYEMPLILRLMKKPELVSTLKRVTSTIFKTGGFLRHMENWGVKQLPCKISAHGHVHREANHFLLRFDVPPAELVKIQDEYSRDIDIVRSRIYKEASAVCQKPCTFHEEMLPPPYRPSVKKLVRKLNRQQKKRPFKYNSGLDYYPFTK